MELDVSRVVVRAIVAYVYLLVLLRLSGKRTLRHASAFDFVLTLIVGDLADNAIWGEAPLAQFAAAAGTLASTHAGLSWLNRRRAHASDAEGARAIS